MTAALLSVRDLRTYFHDGDEVARAVDGVSFDVASGETVAVVGESGSGKSVTALSILRLIRHPGRIEPGSSVVFDGVELLSLGAEQIRSIRGNRIAMIFQEPMSALNPVLTVGEQVAEVVRVHGDGTSKQAWERAVEMLALTGISSPRERANDYPHQLSGGMRQRAMIAMALVLHPALLIADEPTTALDVTIQAQILELLQRLQQRLGMATLLITHDLGVVAEVADRVVVMYGGEVVEHASVEQLFATPHHPYTQGLMGAIPRLEQRAERLTTIPGVVPPSTSWPTGCRFRDRCSYAWDRCESEHPPLYTLGLNHESRCHLAVEPEHRRESHTSAAAHVAECT
ncbi:MAG: ABC transporter ATP-binding protein [Gemmatimonadota bacterium]|nr:ABC transporter ATP-binding protein [Gemmatimonadota bacterium]